MRSINLIYFFKLTLLLLTTHLQAQTINTVAGNGIADYGGNGVLATSVQINSSKDVTIDSIGNLYIADTLNNRIRFVPSQTGTFFGISMTKGNIYTIAGTNDTLFNGDNIPATTANLSAPGGIAVDSLGNVYIADTSHHRIRLVAAHTGSVFGISVTAGNIYTVAGNGMAAYGGDRGLATDATLYFPSNIAIDKADNLYIADTYNHRIRVVSNFSGTILGNSVLANYIYTVAGDGTGGSSGDNGSALAAQLDTPCGLIVDEFDNLYIADTGNNKIRFVASEDELLFGIHATMGHIYTLAGTATNGDSGDGGSASSASLAMPNNVTVDQTGNVFIADTGNNRIRLIAKETGIFYGIPVTANYIYTIAGTGMAGYGGDGGAATSALLNTPTSVASDQVGNLYIADTTNHRIRSVVTAAPTITSLTPNTGSSVGGMAVTITGTDFESGATVLFGENAAPTVIVNSSTEILATAPVGTGVVDVTVTTPFGTSAPSPNAQFTYITPSIVVGVFPPRHFKGTQIKNRFLDRTEYVNVLTWHSPHQGNAPVTYKIYRDERLQELIAEVSSQSQLRFEDHNRKKKRTYHYYIVSIDAHGNVSLPATVKVKG
jgi:sugar lactone lactonase YvrE